MILLFYKITLQPVHYLIKHEEVLPHQTHDSHPALADYGTDNFSIRINDEGTDVIIKPLDFFSSKIGYSFPIQTQITHQKTQQISSPTISFT